MKKIFLSRLTIILLVFSTVFAQEVINSDSTIDLPEVITEIETDSEIAAEETLPDFSDFFVQPETTGSIVPQLPEIQIQENKVAANTTPDSESKIYAEGKLGGGYPMLIYGDFSVYELSPASPFKIKFTHDSASGYAAHSMTDGFNDSSTKMIVEKGLKINNFDFSFDGLYEASENGLQSVVPELSEISQNTISGSGKMNWQLPYYFLLGSSIDLGYYTRFADVTSGSAETPDWVKSFDNFSFSPDLFLNFNCKGFNVDVSGKYSLDTEYEIVNRGEFLGDFSWENDYVKLYTDCSVIVGNKLNQNKALVPFTFAVNSSIPVSFATRRFGINAQGGMDSYRLSASDYEKKYKFSGLSFDPTETSDWFGNIEFIIPVKSIFTSSIRTEYRATAFGNGIWEPVYSDSEFCYGVYGFEQKNRKQLTTDLDFMLNYKIFSMTADWHSNWLYVPVLETENMIDLTFSLKDEKSLWNVNLFTGFYISDELITPLISLSGMYRVTEGVQLVASADDIVNLLSGGSRTYAGQYISRSGTASMMVKFFF